MEPVSCLSDLSSSNSKTIVTISSFIKSESACSESSCSEEMKWSKPKPNIEELKFLESSDEEIKSMMSSHAFTLK